MLIKKIFLILLIISIQSCLLKRSKPATEERVIDICLQATQPSQYLLKRVGKDAQLYAVPNDGKVTITIPAMKGDIFEVLGASYINNDPQEYEILQLKRNSEVLKRLSLKDLDALPTTASGCKSLVAK